MDLHRYKAGIKRFSESDKNTTVIYLLVNGRKKWLNISRVTKIDGGQAEGQDKVVFFHEQLTRDTENVELNILNLIPNTITKIGNLLLNSIPTKDERKKDGV